MNMNDAQPERRELLQLDKCQRELQAFWQEIVVENGPRYRNWREYGHLWTDFWVSLYSCSYLLGHITAVGLPLWGLYELYAWFRG